MSPDVVTDSEWTRPIPRPDAVSAAYWEAAARGELLIQECKSCGHRQFYPRAVCTDCGGDVDWLTCSGRGTVHTFTVIRQNHAKPFKDELPYVVAIVELEEGPRMMSNLVGIEPDPKRIACDMPVEIVFEKLTDEITLPLFKPAGGAR